MRRADFGATEPPTPAGCGERYAHLVVNAAGGTPQQPTGWKPWASDADVNAWLATAAEIFAKVRQRWNALMDAENQTGDHTGSRGVRAFVDAYERSYAALPAEQSVSFNDFEAIAKIIANAQQGACALELLDAASARTPGAPQMPVPYQPPPPKGGGFFDFFGNLGDMLPWIVGIGLALYLFRRDK